MCFTMFSVFSVFVFWWFFWTTPPLCRAYEQNLTAAELVFSNGCRYNAPSLSRGVRLPFCICYKTVLGAKLHYVQAKQLSDIQVSLALCVCVHVSAF